MTLIAWPAWYRRFWAPRCWWPFGTAHQRRRLTSTTLPVYLEPMDLVEIHDSAGVTRRWRLFRARCTCGWRTWPRLSTSAASRDLASHQAGQMLRRFFPPPWWAQ